MHVSWAVATDPGLRRSINEDSARARPDLGLFAVADGMGGHAAGEVASRLAADTIEAFVAETAKADRNRTWPFPFEAGLSLDGNRLKTAFRLANRALADAMAGRPDLHGMATTACAALVVPELATVAHVGDSRAYRLHRGTLSQITRDHSWVEEQVRAGALSASDARRHPLRNVVTRALSGGEDPEVDVNEVHLTPGDRLLLCSDGLYTVVPDDRLQAILAGPEPLQVLADRLVAEANAGGGPDNITLVLVAVDAA